MKRKPHVADPRYQPLAGLGQIASPSEPVQIWGDSVKLALTFHTVARYSTVLLASYPLSLFDFRARNSSGVLYLLSSSDSEESTWRKTLVPS